MGDGGFHIYATKHAEERYRDRVDRTASARDVVLAVVSGEEISVELAMALLGRGPESHKPGDRFVATKCGRALLILSRDGGITTVAALSNRARAVLAA